MELKHRLYPYPILSFYSKDYVKSNFKIDLKNWSINKNHIDFTFEIMLNNKEVENLISTYEAYFGIHAECPATSFRNLYRTNDKSITISIDTGKINGTVQFCFFIIANNEIQEFSSEDFHPIFSNLKFTFEKHNVIAISEQINIPIIKDFDELKNVNSIFLIVPIYDEKVKYIEYDFYKDRIEIKVPHIQFDKYKNIKNIKKYQSIVHSLLIIPALINVFEKLKKGNWDEYEYRWFYSIKKAVERLNYTFDEESFNAIDSIKLAQDVIGNPIINSFDDLFNMMFDGGFDENEN